MPTALVPYNRFAHAPEGGQWHKATFDAPSKPMPPFATFQHDEKAITLHNIADGNLLQMAAPSLEGAPDMKMKVEQSGRNTYKVNYQPNGYTYKVHATYGGQPIQGFPVTMAPKAAHIVQDIPNNEFKIHNVYQPNLVSVNTATLPHKAVYDEKAKTVTVSYNPRVGQGVHDVHVQYKDADIPNSRFRLAPKPQQVPMVQHAPMMYQTQAYMGPMLMQPMPVQPVQYAKPILAAPVHITQAGAPMLMHPMLMQPAQAVSGHAPMVAPAPSQAVSGYAPMVAQAPSQAGYYAPYPNLK